MPSTEPQIHPRAASRAAFAFILITICFDFLAFGIIAPILPNLIIQFEGGNIARAATITGYFAFIWATMQFVFSPLLGAWSDRFGRRPVILLSCFGLGFDYILMAVSPTLAWLFLGRVISGITTSNISTAFAYITDVTPPEQRAKKFGWLSAAFGLGFVIGPFVGGFLGNHNLRLPFWVAAGLSLANAVYGFFILPESLPPERRAKSAWHMANPLGSLSLLRSHPELAGLSVVCTLYYLAHQALPSVFVLYGDYRYSWTPKQVGFVLAAVGVGIAVVTGGLVSPLVKKLGERRVLIMGLTFGVLAYLGFGASPTGSLFVASIPLIALWSVAGPTMQSVMSRCVDPTSQGKLQGAINSIRSLTGMFGPLMFTQVFATAISPRIAHHIPGAPFYLAALLMAGCAAIAAYVTRTDAPPSHEPPAAAPTPDALVGVE